MSPCLPPPPNDAHALIATAASNLVFSWVVRVGEFCHPELPGNAKIVYIIVEDMLLFIP